MKPARDKLEKMLDKTKHFLGFHDWEEPHIILWSLRDYSLWFYCKSQDCNKRKTIDYEFIPGDLRKNIKPKYQITRCIATEPKPI